VVRKSTCGAIILSIYHRRRIGYRHVMTALRDLLPKLLALAVVCTLSAGCTLLTFDKPVVPPVLPNVLTPTDIAIVQAAVSARLAGQPVQFGKTLPGVKYKLTESFTVCGQVETGGATTFYIGYLSRERGEFAVASMASSGQERQTVIGACTKAGADTTIIEYPPPT
jgi:hypothetical protein